MNYKKYILLFGFLLLNLVSFSQKKQYDIRKKGFITLPFEYKNDFIIIKATINKWLPMKFIYDTGAQNTIFTEKVIFDLLGVPKTKKFTILGSDQKTELIAYLALGLHFDFQSIVVPYYNVLVLEEDYFNFKEVNGIDVQGILGADLFRSFVVKIDYSKALITLYNPEYYYKKFHKKEWIDIEVISNRPYITTTTKLENDTIIQTKYLIDTGASLPLLINTDTHPLLSIPKKCIPGHIGTGLGGFLEGYTGRIKEINLGPYVFNNVITNFQQSTNALDSFPSYSRNGIIGNQILNRFTVTIDFSKKKIHLKPNRHFKDKFEYDKSGLILIGSGKSLRSISVQYIVPDSPADKNDFQKGDILLSINYFSTRFFSLSDITRKLAKREGKKVRIKIKRGEQTIVKRIVLKELI